MKLTPIEVEITHELILSVHNSKRVCSYLSIDGVFFDGLGSEQGQNQDLISHFTYVVLKNGVRHKETILEICSFILEQEHDRGLSGIRISTGKHINEDHTPKYDNYVDINFSKLCREDDEAQLQAFIAKVLSYNKIIKKETLCKSITVHTHLAD